jgi:hypothetical protein
LSSQSQTPHQNILHLEVFKQLFVNRTDCYCIQLKQGYTRVEQSLTDAVLEKHLRGELTAGSYQLNQENLVKWLCFDFDPEKLEDPKEATRKILSVCFEKKEEADGISRPRVWPHSVLLEASRYPDPSFHVWLLFLLPISAKVAQWLGYCILELANLNPKQVEIFPKQAELSRDRPYGNFVKLPFGFHQVEHKWSRMLNFDTFKPIPLHQLESKCGLSFSESDLADIKSLETKKGVQTTFELPNKFKTLSDSEEEKAARFLCKYWQQGARNRLEMYFLGLCLKKGVSYSSAKCIINTVADRTCDPERQSRLDLVDYHYRSRLNVSLKASSGIREIIEEMRQK